MKWICPLTGGPLCGLCLANYKKDAGYRGHAGYKARGKSQWRRRMAITRSSAGEGGARRPLRGSSDPIGSRYPVLWEFLTEAVFSDGAERQLPTLLLLCEDGLIKGCLNDRAELRSAWVSGEGLDAVLEALDCRLKEESMEWRRVTPRPAGRRS